MTTGTRPRQGWLITLVLWGLPVPVLAAETLIRVCVPVEFVLFAATLFGVAFLHRHTLAVALTGLATIVGYKLVFTGFKEGPGFTGFLAHLGHEWVILANLLGLLLGFALLARHFEDSHIPRILPRYLPAGWQGGLILLGIIFVLSSFLDNIAAALVGGTIAASLFKYRVHIGYLAAIVAASNAGGSGSVLGDTTTTMMWISGIGPAAVFDAYVAAVVALVVFGVPAAMQQRRHAAMVREVPAGTCVDWVRVGIVGFMLLAAFATNLVVNRSFKGAAEHFPFLGVAVWIALLAAVPLRRPEWGLLPETLKGSVFLLSLVLCASLMPVEELPPASWISALALGFVSAVFDNIPLTALAIKQGGYDWGMLAYAVGFGGSMLWFGSSAGVALSNLFPEAKSVGAWVRHGWHIALAYVAGFTVFMLLVGWQPAPPGSDRAAAEPPAAGAPGGMGPARDQGDV